jgi:3-hydroxybutyryl-CoA dehydrogenase
MKSQIGVVGAGVIGRGVAQSFAAAGFPVVLLDLSEDVLVRARQEMERALRFQSMLTKSASKQDPGAVLSNIAFTSAYNLLDRVDLVIENVPEIPATKQQVYLLLDKTCPKACIFAANTSAIPIARIASWTQRADRVIGAHFMNPVPLKPVVEVVRGAQTSEDTIAKLKEILAGAGKEGIVVNDAPGFVSNRVLMLTINEAISVVQDGVATAEQVDKLFKTCFGHKMGPLETADLIGLDTIVHTLNVLFDNFQDPKFHPCPLLLQMAGEGLYGRKSGRGFYCYTPERQG